MVLVFWDLVIVIGGIVMAAVAFADDLSKYRFFNGLKENTPIKIIVFLFGAGLVCWGTIAKGIDAKEESDRSYQYAQDQQKLRDSIADLKRKESNNELISSFGNAIGKYGLTFDSVKNEIIRLRKDTSRRTVTNVYGKDPSFGLCEVAGLKITRQTEDSIYLDVNFCTDNARASNLNIHYDLIRESAGQLKLLGSNNPFQKQSWINETNRKTDPVFLVGDISSISKIYIHVKGTYENSDNTKKFNLDAVYSLDVNTKSFFNVYPDIRDRILKFLGEE